MHSESNGLAWFANLRNRFNTFCSEADDIMPQEPIEYVRNHFLAAGESLKQLYTEVVEDVLIFMSEENGQTTSPKQEENSGLPCHKMSNTSSINNDDHEERSEAVNSSSPILSNEEPVGENLYIDLPSKEKGKIGMRMDVVENPLLMETLESSRTLFLVVDSCEKTEQSSNFPDAKCSTEVQQYNESPDDEVASSVSAWSTEAIHSNVPDSDLSGYISAKEWEMLDEDPSESEWEII